MRRAAHFAAIRLVCAALLIASSTPIVNAGLPHAAEATDAAQAKDIVVDRPTAPTSQPAARLVPRPNESSPATQPTTSTHRAALAGAVAELGLDLLRSTPGKTANAVVSPASVSVALGILHGGVAPADAAEIARLFGGTRMGAAMLQQHLPQALRAAAAVPKDGSPAALKLASRLWVHQAVASQLQPAYLKTLDERYQASGAAVDFAANEIARDGINRWVSERTAGLIPAVLGPGSITPNTRLVLTQATHFRSPWAQPFDPAATQVLPFQVAGGASKPVPTLVGEMKVLSGQSGSWQVIELPFKQGDIAVQIAMPDKGTPLSTALEGLHGLDVAGWAGALQPHDCLVQLPKLMLQPATQSLKAALQAQGVQRVFGAQASFAPALGAAGQGLQLDDLFHTASLTLDERGGEAAAATAAVTVVKSFTPAVPRQCKVDRPFLLVLLHKPTQLPLFVATVQDPSQP